MTFDTNIQATKPSIFFIIPEFGKRDLTDRCIKSIYSAVRTLRNRDYHKCLIIISDDGFKKVKKFKHSEYYVGTIPSIEFNWPDNVNFAENVNRAVRFIEPKDNDILFMVNSDIEFDKGTISAMLDYLKKEKGIIGPAVIDPYNGTHIQVFDKEVYSNEDVMLGKIEALYSNLDETSGYKISEAMTEEFLLPVTALSGCCFALQAELWKHLGGFDSKNFPAFFEDDDLCIRVNIAGYKVVVNLKVSVHHVRGATMRSQPDNLDHKHMASSKANFEKKWPEITWDATGLYEIPKELLDNEFLDKRVRF